MEKGLNISYLEYHYENVYKYTDTHDLLPASIDNDVPVCILNISHQHKNVW